VTGPTTATWQVVGMTCGHCVSAVREELGALDGVQSVDVVLESGSVTVVSEGPLEPQSVVAAVEEAGYQLA
jgi:copper ion binding protein